MQQLHIDYFFPLTQQVLLDLDFTPCENYIAEERQRQFLANPSSYIIGEGGVGIVNWGSVSLKDIEPNFTIDIDQMPITVKSKEKPNFIKRYMYKALGLKWKVT